MTITKLTKENEELSSTNKKIVQMLTKTTQEKDSQVAAAKKEVERLELERNQAIEDKEKSVKRVCFILKLNNL